MFKLDRKKFDLARAKKCYNLTDVAKNAHICYSTLTKILNGSINLTAKSLGKISKALDVEPADLIQDWYKRHLERRWEREQSNGKRRNIFD